MPRINNRAVGGQPSRPYADFNVNANKDCWLELTFLDRYGNTQIPTAVSYWIDNLTNNISILGPTAFNGTLSATIEINIPASTNTMSYTWPGSQVNQITVQAQFADGSVDTEVFVYNLVQIYTVSAGLQF